MKKTLVRCGEKNNFNFTEAELKALERYSAKADIFVNSNSFVRITGNFPCIITINPYLSFVEPSGDLSLIRACRIKWVCGAQMKYAQEQLAALSWCVEHKIPALITFFRFRSWESHDKYATKGSSNYIFNSGWLRPTKEVRDLSVSCIKALARGISDADDKLVHFCDLNGTGCPDCGNCIKLVMGEDQFDNYEIKSLNLEESGDGGKCIFNCPDCWARYLLMGRKPKLNVLFANRKQKGQIKHL